MWRELFADKIWVVRMNSSTKIWLLRDRISESVLDFFFLNARREVLANISTFFRDRIRTSVFHFCRVFISKFVFWYKKSEKYLKIMSLRNKFNWINRIVLWRIKLNFKSWPKVFGKVFKYIVPNIRWIKYIEYLEGLLVKS